MSNKKVFKHIRVGIAIVNSSELRLAVNGERLGDYENEFDDWYCERLKQVMNHKQWGVMFKQSDEHTPEFEVDIYTNDVNDFASIHNLISSEPHRAIKFRFNAPYWGFEKFLEMTGQQFPD